MKDYKDSMEESSSKKKKPKTVRFDTPKPNMTTQEDLEVIDDSPPISPMEILEENH